MQALRAAAARVQASLTGLGAAFYFSFVGWYICTSVFSISAKQALAGSDKVQHAPVATPLSLGILCFAAGLLLTSANRPKLWCNLPSVLLTVDPPQMLMSLAHTVGTLLTLSALANGSLAVTYAVKACEPLTTAALTALVLGTAYTPWQLLALVPVAAGLAIASSPGLAPSTGGTPPRGGLLLAGALPAILSNVMFSARTTLAKLKQLQLEAAPEPPHTPSDRAPRSRSPTHVLAQFGYTVSPARAPVAASRPGALHFAAAPRLPRPAPLRGAAAAAAAASGSARLQSMVTQAAWAEVGGAEDSASGWNKHPFDVSESEGEGEESGRRSATPGVASPAGQADMPLPPPVAPLPPRALPAPRTAPAYEMDNLDRLLLANVHALLLCTVLLAQDEASLAALSQLGTGAKHFASALHTHGWDLVLGQPVDGVDGGSAARQPVTAPLAADDDLTLTAGHLAQAGAAGHALNASAYHAVFSVFSFLVLNHISPAAHSLGNVCKRLFMVGAAAAVLGQALAGVQFVGMAVSLLGVCAFTLLPGPVAGQPGVCSRAPAACVGACATFARRFADALNSWWTVSALHLAVVVVVYLGHAPSGGQSLSPPTP